MISVGQVTDQEVFDAFYPEDMVITFNAPSAVADPSAIPPQPAAANYTITERTTGKVLVANALYTKGEEIEINGVSLNIAGNPSPPTSATLPFNFDTAAMPIPAGTSFKVSVNGRTEPFPGGAAGATPAAFVTALNTAPNDTKLSNLGLTATASGFASASGANIRVHSGTTALDSAIGLASSVGVTSTNGVVGDSFFIESTNKQGLLTTLSRFSDAMKNVKDTAESKAELAEMVAKTITNLTNAETTIVSVQGEIGARQNTLESARDLNLDVILYSQQTLSSLEDVDVAEATIRLSMQSLVLQASQQGFAKVSQLTLFSYL